MNTCIALYATCFHTCIVFDVVMDAKLQGFTSDTALLYVKCTYVNCRKYMVMWVR